MRASPIVNRRPARISTHAWRVERVEESRDVLRVVSRTGHRRKRTRSVISKRAMNVIGFDDGPFPREHRGDVLLVGTVCSGTRLDGVMSGTIRRDGANAAQ